MTDATGLHLWKVQARDAAGLGFAVSRTITTDKLSIVNALQKATELIRKVEKDVKGTMEITSINYEGSIDG